MLGAQIVQVCLLSETLPWLRLTLFRMLENPSDESVVRWGNDGDSFVVLEVCEEHDER